MLLSTGQILQERYRVVKLLAQGGFGSVYRAWDIRLNMPVALKESLDTSTQAERQFSHEARLLSNLTHPNLPRVLDFFTIPGQGLYLVMEFVSGQDLEERLEAAGGPVSESQALPWILQVCDALIYLHTRTPPTIHRDIKPANIRITPEGQAFLVDFGIAKQFDPNARTMTGARAVTPGYAPFEQYGQRSTDARTDIYALGATLYHLLTGQRPPESIDRVAGTRLPPPRQFNPGIHPGIESAILRAMQIMPEQRYPSIAEFRQDLVNPVEPTLQVKAPVQQSIAAPVQAALPREPARESARVAPQPAVYPTPAAPRRIPKSQPKRSKFPLAGIAAGAMILLVVIAAGVAYLSGFLDNQDNLAASKTALAATQNALGSHPSRTPSPTPSRPTTSPTQPPTASIPPPSPTPVETDAPPPSPTSIPPPEASPTPVLPEGQIVDPQGVLMALIPAGEFWMGNDTDAWPSRPMRSVYLDAYFIDIYEVTNAAYKNCVDAGVCAPPLRTKSQTRASYFGDAAFANFPVVQVNWEMAQQYCQWRGGGLPTEAQWEKAARGADQRTLPWGEETLINCRLANYTGCSTEDTDAVDSHPDGKSPYGLFDMAGNVREWVADWYAMEYYRTAPTQNPTGPASGEYRAVRGGSWQDTSNFLRSYYRLPESPSTYSYWIGFRCARPSE